MDRFLKILIWAYVVLLLVEGALRKWIFPGIAEPLLIVRDPVVVGIYILALVRGSLPLNGFVISILGLAVASVISSLLGGMSNALVIAYGVRINYFHLPLIWVMGTVLTRRDVELLGAFILLSAIPMTFLMVEQFSSPMDAWINKGVGADEGGQIFGADGRIRPPGTFAFITGPQLYFPFCAAFFFDQVAGHGRLKWPLLVGAGIAILVALPVSISRTVMLATGIVGAVFVITLPFAGGKGIKMLKPLLLLGIVAAVVTQLPIFKQGSMVFGMRWETAATATEGDGWADVVDRTISTITNPLYYAMEAPLFGRGIGVGSNVGARLLSGQVGFLLAEEEYGKIYMELGAIVGTGFIFLRLFLAGYLALRSIRALFENKDALPLLLFSATCVPLVNGQWAPPTVLGFTVVGSGLLLGALNSVKSLKPAPELAPIITFAPAMNPALPVASALRLPIIPKTVSKQRGTSVHEDRYHR
ncbi:MAG: hypothetical protein V4773_17830 [Verrucomicrobiota bacterium]